MLGERHPARQRRGQRTRWSRVLLGVACVPGGGVGSGGLHPPDVRAYGPICLPGDVSVRGPCSPWTDPCEAILVWCGLICALVCGSGTTGTARADAIAALGTPPGLEDEERTQH